jgi:hypothetical protein
MLDPELADDARLLVRTSQIIVLALAMGCVLFLGITYLYRTGLELPTDAPPIGQKKQEKPQETKPDGAVKPVEEKLPQAAVDLAKPPARLTYVILVATIPLLIARFIIPRIYVATVVRRLVMGEEVPQYIPGNRTSLAEWLIKKHGEAGVLAQAFLTRTIIAAAMMEAAAMLAIVAFLLQGETAALVASAIMIVLLLLLWPTTGVFMDWVRDEMRQVGDHRQFESPEE